MGAAVAVRWNQRNRNGAYEIIYSNQWVLVNRAGVELFSDDRLESGECSNMSNCKRQEVLDSVEHNH
jgi:hypothetical protein